MKTLAPCLFIGLALIANAASGADDAPQHWRFDFGPGAVAPDWTCVTPESAFDPTKGYGFETGPALTAIDRGGPDSLAADFVTSTESFRFSVAVPEGNYRVRVVLGDLQGDSITTVKAETRRLLLEHVRTTDGQIATRAFTVNVRTPALPPGNVLKLDSRETTPGLPTSVTTTWDDRLTLQFSGERPCVCAVEIERVDDAVTVFLLGDSTVTDQASEPYGTWGQMLPRWFGPAVAVANHAESGQTLKAFRAQNRWAKVMLAMKPGDYVFLQFGHNDRNARGHDGIWPREDTLGDWINTHAEAGTDYTWLLAAYAVEVKRRGGTPVIVSPMTKIDMRTGELNEAGLGDYPKAAREAAEMAGAVFIDLNAMSTEVMRALGPQHARAAYVDGLHSNSYGGYLFSRCIVEGIRRAGLDLAQQLVDDTGEFDPASPHPLPDEFVVPLEPRPAPVPPPPPKS